MDRPQAGSYDKQSRRVDVAFYIHRSGGSVKRDPPYDCSAGRFTGREWQSDGMCRSRLAGDQATDAWIARKRAPTTSRAVGWMLLFTSTAAVDR
ncbi:conserved protein of unknown function [Ectopseudomonas oleovorans]|uniref:Uncharacterized protein n=1 Tax=Ectopseudomonas oleovorans TaxID=301 RepID=A0A653AXV1_ECTOL|nr:conserved protein of unknown function [Pseudomonas oleovorans]